MKKIVITLMFTVGILYAGAYTKADRIKDMKQMADAMGTIQRGFFYNNFDTVAKGVNSLSDAAERVKPPMEEVNEKNPMARYMDGKVKMTHKIVKKINQKALTILERFKGGDSAQAVQAYTKIVGQCMKCHREIRQW